MTLLVGINCKEGVVIGADTSATFISSQPTIQQPMHKISVVEGKVVVASTGAVGQSQRLVSAVRQLWKGGKLAADPISVGKIVSQAVLADFGQSMSHLPHLLVNKQLQFGALLAYVHQKKAYLLEFEPQSFQPEVKDDRLWYVSLGAGQAIADPFLALMRRCFFRDGPPSLATGRLAAAWTLHHTCEVHPGGVKDPFHLAEIEGVKGNANELDEDAMAEHQEMIRTCYSYLEALPTVLADPSASVDPIPDGN